MDTSRMDRRLRVVLFADVAGFTHLSSNDERTAIGVAEALREIAEETAATGGGRVVKHLGDGVLAVFDGARHGVSAALTMAAALEIRTSGFAGGPYPLRAGLHMGEIVETQSGDVFGDAVNRASRIQSEAEPGQVFVSQAMVDLMRQDHRFRFEDRGERALKGIDGATRVYRAAIADASGAAAAPERRGAATAPASAEAGSGVGHPFHDRRVRRWAMAMGTTVAVAAFVFLSVGTGAFSAFRDGETEPDAGAAGSLPDRGAAAEEEGPAASRPDESTREVSIPVVSIPAVSIPAESGQGESVTDDSSEDAPADAADTDGSAQGESGMTTDPGTEEAGSSEEAEVPADPSRPAPRTPEELATLRPWLFSEPAQVARQLGPASPPGSPEEEEMRLTALILSGQANIARARLDSLAARVPDFLPPLTRARYHFRAADYAGAARVLQSPGAIPLDRMTDAAVLGARLAAIRGGPAAAIEQLDRVPEAQRTDLWRGWRGVFEAEADQDRPGQGLLRALRGDTGLRSEGREEGEGRYVAALLLRRSGNAGLSQLAIDAGRRDQLLPFLWVDVDPEWGR